MHCHPLPTASLALLSTLLFSCTPPWDRAVVQSRHSTASLTADAYRFAVMPSKDTAHTVDERMPPTIKTLDQFVTWGLKRNPRLAARALFIRAQESTIAQISLPDPVFKAVPFGDMAETAAGSVAYSVGIEQKFPALGLLGAQAQQASARTKNALAQFDSEKVALAFHMRIAWHTYQWAQSSLKITAQQIDLLEPLQQVILARVESRVATQSDAVRIGVVIDDLHTQHRKWSERVRNAHTSLVSVMNTHPEMRFPPLATTEALPPMNGAQLDRIATSARPEFLANQADIDLAKAQGLIAQTRKKPSFGTFFNYTAVDDSGLSAIANGADQWSIGFSLTIPLWRSSYAAADAEALFRHQQAQFDREALTDSVYQEAHSAWETQRSATEQLAIIRRDILVGAQRALQLETASYAAGDSSYQDVIQSWRSLFAAELQEAFVAKSHAIAIADTIRALGLTAQQQVREHTRHHEQKEAE